MEPHGTTWNRRAVPVLNAIHKYIGSPVFLSDSTIMAEGPSVVYDEATHTVTVALPTDDPHVGELDFSICEGARMGSIEKLVVVGHIHRTNFVPFRGKGEVSWQNRFVPNPTIDLSGVYVNHWRFACDLLWHHDPSKCVLPLHHLKPRRVDFPLNTWRINRFQGPRPTSNGTGLTIRGVCGWDLSGLKTTNLADLYFVTKVLWSFNRMPSLEELVLPENVEDINDSMHDVGTPGQVWPNPFEKCKKLEDIVNSFKNVPLVSFILPREALPNIQLINSFHSCHELKTFKCTKLGGIRECLVNNEKLHTLHLQGFVTGITHSVKDCPDLENIDLKVMDHNRGFGLKISNSFNNVGKLTAVAIPPHANFINGSFTACPLLRTVDFLKDPRSNKSFVGEVNGGSFHTCAIELVTNFEHTHVKTLSGQCFANNPLQYIAVPSTVREIYSDWARDLSQATKTSHLDLSRLNRFVVYKRNLSVPTTPPQELRGFDNVWITRFNADTPNFPAKDLLTLLHLFTNPKSTVYCAAGQEKKIKARMAIEPLGKLPEAARDVSRLTYLGSKVDSLSRRRLALMSLNDKSSGVAPAMIYAAYTQSPVVKPGLNNLDIHLVQTILTILLNTTAYREPTQRPVRGGGATNDRKFPIATQPQCAWADDSDTDSDTEY
jgi:hypothetical protein